MVGETSSCPEKDDALHEAQGQEGATRVRSEDLFRDTTIPPLRFCLLSISICLGLFMSMLDSSIVATSLFTIGKEFDDMERMNWIALAYTLSYIGCAAFFSRMTDIIGRRGAFMVAFVIFFAFSLGCGFAQNMDTLIACRALQGVGGSGLYSVTMITFPELSPDHLRRWIASIIGIVIAVAGVLGPVLGGILTQYASWRWVFWINGPLGAVSMTLFYITWPKKEHLPNIERRSWKDLDFVGSLLVIASSVLVVFAFQNAGSNVAEEPWTQATFIAPIVAGTLCWVALFAWEAYFERRWPDKMAAFPLSLFRNHVYASGVLNTMFLGFPYMTTIYALPLRLQVVNGKSPLKAGVMLLPMLGGVAIGSSMGGVVSGKKNRIFETLVVATILVMIGCALETTAIDSAKLEPKVLGFLAFIGFGFGLSASASTMMTAIEAPIQNHAPAQGILAQTRIFGGSIGIAASSAILAVKQRTQLGGVVSSSALTGGGNGLTATQMTAIRKAYNDSFTETMMVCAIVAGVGIFLTLGVYRRNRVTIDEQRKAQIREEVERRRAQKAAVLTVSSGRSA